MLTILLQSTVVTPDQKSDTPKRMSVNQELRKNDCIWNITPFYLKTYSFGALHSILFRDTIPPSNNSSDSQNLYWKRSNHSADLKHWKPSNHSSDSRNLYTAFRCPRNGLNASSTALVWTLPIRISAVRGMVWRLSMLPISFRVSAESFERFQYSTRASAEWFERFRYRFFGYTRNGLNAFNTLHDLKDSNASNTAFKCPRTGLNASNTDFGGSRNGLKASIASNIAFGCQRNGLSASNADFGCLRNGLNASSTDFGCPRNGLKAELYFGIDRNGELHRNMFWDRQDLFLECNKLQGEYNKLYFEYNKL